MAHFWKAAVLVGLGVTASCGTSKEADDSGHAAAGVAASGAPGEAGGSHAQATAGTGAATGGKAADASGSNQPSGGAAGSGATSVASGAGGKTGGSPPSTGGTGGVLERTGGAAGDAEDTGGRASATGGNTSGRGGHGGEPEKTGGAAGSGHPGPGAAGETSGQGGQAHGGGQCDYPGPCTCTVTHGSATRIVTTYTYDADGKLVREEQDSNDDGLDVTVLYSYDNAGRLVEEKAVACAAELPYCMPWTTYSYDEQGNLLVEEPHLSAPGSNPVCKVHTYDELGLVVRTEYREWCMEEPSALRGVDTYEYDAAGRVVAHDSDNGTGDNVFTQVYEYDANGRLSRETTTDSDGVVDVTLYTRNGAGQVLTEERQYEYANDLRLIHTYDEDGNELTSTLVYLEGESAGVQQDCYVSTYDDCGNRLTQAYSWTCEQGAADQAWSWSYACFEG